MGVDDRRVPVERAFTRPGPPLGRVPHEMVAAVIRPDRYGPPATAFRLETIPLPTVGPREVVVRVMAAGVNFNGVWAALGLPFDVIAARRARGATEEFHVAGSDAAGIVWAVGDEARVHRPGDAVIVAGLRGEEAWSAGSPRPRVWGYESNYGALAQFTVVDEAQCHAKPAALAWEQAACFLVTATTAQRQLFGWAPHVANRDTPLLVWGGAGGLGSMALQLARNVGAPAVAVVSDAARAEHCRRLGACGTIDRRAFTHWGPPPDAADTPATARFIAAQKEFRRQFAAALGDHRRPFIVFEHPGRATLPTSLSLCDNGGMVVLCGGTTGHLGEIDLRPIWLEQKRLQGSTYGTRVDRQTVIDQVAAGRLDPCLSRVVPLEEVGRVHQQMLDNQHPPGQMAILVDAPRSGLTAFTP